MNILEKVYCSFRDLELNYDNSISRKEFILSKFGGDIDIGSTIIIDAIMNEGINTAQEIEKFSYLKDVFAFFSKIKDSLDKLTSFNIDLQKPETVLSNNVLSLLEDTKNRLFVKPLISQKELFQKHKAIYYYITPEESHFIDCTDNSCSIFKVISPTMMTIMKLIVPENTNPLKLNAYYCRVDDRYTKLSYTDLKKYFS